METPFKPAPKVTAPDSQFSLKDLLLLIFLVAVVLGYARFVGGGIGALELAVLIIGGLVVSSSLIKPPWGALCATALAVAVSLLIAAPVIVLGLLAIAGPVLLVSSLEGARPRPWAFGQLACLTTAAACSPSDPISLPIAFLPAGLLMNGLAILFVIRRETTRNAGCALILLGGGLCAARLVCATFWPLDELLAPWVNALFATSGAPVAVLGVWLAWRERGSRVTSPKPLPEQVENCAAST